jgi:hypothetical protein
VEHDTARKRFGRRVAVAYRGTGETMQHVERSHMLHRGSGTAALLKPARVFLLPGDEQEAKPTKVMIWHIELSTDLHLLIDSSTLPFHPHLAE